MEILLTTNPLKAFSSDYYSGCPPNNAFDDNTSTYWYTSKALPQYIGYDSVTQSKVTKYALFGGWQERATSWQFQGSNDYLSWEVLDIQSNQEISSYKEYMIANNKFFRYYRLYITKSGTEISAASLATFKMFGFLIIHKYLIKQGDNYYSIKDNQLTQLGVPIDDTQKEEWFNDYGVEDLKEALLIPDTNGNKLIDSLNDQFEIRMMKAK